jgi:CRISPR/Cas system-associated exonuclease Cas4 (RecB family)
MLQNMLKLFRKPDGTEVRFIRASTLGHYWYCAVQAWLQCCGIESPSNEALSIGKAIHDSITGARQPSRWETEFEVFLKQFMVERATGQGSTGLKGEEYKVFQRAWYDRETIIGHVTTHGVDDFRVSPERKVVLVEYKTTGQRIIDYYKLMPAVFQLKVYMWILEPYLKIGAYTIKRGEIVFLDRKGKPLGCKEITDYTAAEIEDNIARILSQFKHPETLIPPAKWKCFNCPEVWKSKCPFQKGEDDAQQ